MNEREQETVDYIRQNWDRQDRLAVFLINRQDQQNYQHLRTADQIVSPAYQSALGDMNANGYDVFISMSALKPAANGRTKDHVAEVRHVFLDVDAEGARIAQEVAAHPDLPQPHHILETSPGKRQIIWSVAGFTIPQAETLMRAMAHTLGTDTQVWDVARVLRLPGFVNNKYPELRHVVHDVGTGQTPATEYRPEHFQGFDVSQSQAVDRRATGPAPQRTYGVDRSAQDFGWVMSKLERGESSEQVKRDLMERRPDKPKPEYYANYTVDKALGRMNRGQGVANGNGY